MTGEKPALGQERETNWPDEMDDEDRVMSVVTTAGAPHSVEWIAERAGVDDSTARSVLNTAEDVEEVAGGYQVDPEARHRRQRERIKDKSDEELRELRADIRCELDGDEQLDDHRRRRREHLLELIDDCLY